MTDLTSDNQGLTPKLRFPEFRDSGEWQQKKLNALLSEPKKRNRNLKYGPTDVLSVSGEHGCVNQIEFMGRSYAGVSVKDYHVVETGDVVYTKSPLKIAPYGIIKENKGRAGIVSTLYAVYRPTGLGHGAFIDYFFSRPYNLNSYLQPIVRKGAKNDMKVNNSDVLSGGIWVPSVSEQRKIAECLSSLDALIGVETEKLNALRDHKKGLMQRLFPAQGEAIPSLRFPEFRHRQEWIELPLQELCEINPPAETLPSKFTYIDLGAVECGQIINAEIIEREGAPSRAQRLLRRGDILYQTVRPYQRNNLFFDSDELEFVASTGYAQLRANESSNFLYHLVNTDNFVDRVIERCSGSNYPAINSSDLSSITVFVPQVDEQEIIGRCLSAFDTQIVTQSDRINSLKSHKSGLVRQLFPSPNVVAV